MWFSPFVAGLWPPLLIAMVNIVELWVEVFSLVIVSICGRGEDFAVLHINPPLIQVFVGGRSGDILLRAFRRPVLFFHGLGL